MGNKNNRTATEKIPKAIYTFDNYRSGSINIDEASKINKNIRTIMGKIPKTISPSIRIDCDR